MTPQYGNEVKIAVLLCCGSLGLFLDCSVKEMKEASFKQNCKKGFDVLLEVLREKDTLDIGLEKWDM